MLLPYIQSNSILTKISIGVLNFYLLICIPVATFISLSWYILWKFERRWSRKAEEQITDAESAMSSANFGSFGSISFAYAERRRREARLFSRIMAIAWILYLLATSGWCFGIWDLMRLLPRWDLIWSLYGVARDPTRIRAFREEQSEEDIRFLLEWSAGVVKRRLYNIT